MHSTVGPSIDLSVQHSQHRSPSPRCTDLHYTARYTHTFPRTHTPHNQGSKEVCCARFECCFLSPTARVKIYKQQVKAHSSFLSLITLTLSIYSLHILNTSTMLYSTIFTLAMATAAAAIKVTAPSNSTGWTSTGAQVIEWDVSTVSISYSCL